MLWTSTEVAVEGEKNAKPNKVAFNSVLPPACQTIPRVCTAALVTIHRLDAVVPEIVSHSSSASSRASCEALPATPSVLIFKAPLGPEPTLGATYVPYVLPCHGLCP